MNTLLQAIESRLNNGETNIIKITPILDISTVKEQDIPIRVEISGVKGSAIIEYSLSGRSIINSKDYVFETDDTRCAKSDDNPELEQALIEAIDNLKCESQLYIALDKAVDKIYFPDLLAEEAQTYTWELISDNIAHCHGAGIGQMTQIKGTKNGKEVSFEVFLQLPDNCDSRHSVNGVQVDDSNCCEELFDVIKDKAIGLLYEKYSKDGDTVYADLAFATEQPVVRYEKLENGDYRAWHSADDEDFTDLEECKHYDGTTYYEVVDYSERENQKVLRELAEQYEQQYE